MIKTSTLTIISSLTPSQSEKKQEELQLPEFSEPSATCINSILNFSKSYQVLKSAFVNEIEIVRS